jgi:hypothetical protein
MSYDMCYCAHKIISMERSVRTVLVNPTFLSPFKRHPNFQGKKSGRRQQLRAEVVQSVLIVRTKKELPLHIACLSPFMRGAHNSEEQAGRLAVAQGKGLDSA